MVEPLDRMCRLINGKKGFPPIYLRRYVGPLSTFESSGAEFVAYSKLIGQLKPHERVLDIGCGCGLMAIYLRDYIAAQGRYVGVDIYPPVVRWAQRRLGTGNVEFMHIDVKNGVFNRRGAILDADYVFPFDGQSFDFVLAKSVFTHMQEAGISRYLQEIGRLLSPDGRALITWFLLNTVQEELLRQGLNAHHFAFGDGRSRWVYKSSPESAIGYSEAVVLDMLDTNGLELDGPILYGTWSGREGVSFQDMMLIRRKRDIGVAI
jgi:SAM-dependent methyltransferase